MMFFHPLISTPMFVFTLCFEIKPAKIRSLIQIITTAFSLPILFLIYQVLNKQSNLILNPLDRLQAFFNLFANPFIERYPYIPWYYDVTYGTRYWLPIIVILLAGLILIKNKNKILAPYKTWLIGLMISIFFVSTTFVFDGIIGHEQQEFALRLLQCFYVSGLPVIIYLIATKIIIIRYDLLKIFLILFASYLLTISWYFSYPQYNLKYPFFAPSVSSADILAVNYIHKRANSEDYIVLSNQMTSAAALQEFGFLMYHSIEEQEVLWYAIPTGGDLYQRFTRILAYPDTSEEIIDYIFEETEVKKIYVVLHMYWPWSSEILQTLNDLSVDEIHINNEIYIFEFTYED